jgi:hypothetical protein
MKESVDGLIRVSTFVYVSSLIGQCGGEKEVVASRNNHLIRQSHNHYMSCCCHITNNNPFYIHKLKDCITLLDDL